MRRNETPYTSWMKFCRMVDIHDVITQIYLGDARLRGSGVAGVKFWLFLLTLLVVLTVRVCDTVSMYRSVTNGTYSL